MPQTCTCLNTNYSDGVTKVEGRVVALLGKHIPEI